jgi:hypothetical protein
VGPIRFEGPSDLRRTTDGRKIVRVPARGGNSIEPAA